MGRTLPSYRRMLEKERFLWEKHFASRLREPHRSGFTTLWEKAFQLADAASANTRPLMYDNIVMSMLIAQQVEIQRLNRELNRLKELLSSQDTI
ncbi:hypothetical protein [Candidatus Hodarchaeum mangrovi]